MGTRRRVPGGTAALAAVLVLLLGGCSGTAQSPPSPTPGSGTEAPTTGTAPLTERPVPLPHADTDRLGQVAAFVVRPDVLELRDDAGAVVTTLSYLAPPAQAIAVLTDVFGEPPVEEEYRKTNHTPPGIYHSWDQLVLDERFYDEERRSSEGLDNLVWPRFAVYFFAPASNGMPMSSIQGIQAGDSWESAAGRPGFQSELHTCIGTPVDVVGFSRADGAAAHATVVAVESEEGTVEWLSAPEMVADGCA